MRRPLKPFVTEYKPSSRRQLSPARPISFASDTQQPAPRSGEGGQPDAASRTEDSYEAALRAADALFSPRATKPQPSSAGLGDDETESNRSRDTAGGGRILRVIDDPAPEPASEAASERDGERAPNRRGRKPGSKNKPKPEGSGTRVGLVATSTGPQERDDDPSSATASDARTPLPAAVAEAAAGPTGDPSDARPEVDGEHDYLDDQRDAATQGAEERGTTVSPRERRRFSWVRTKLKPGQEWKRRLPKVCW